MRTEQQWQAAGQPEPVAPEPVRPEPAPAAEPPVAPASEPAVPVTPGTQSDGQAGAEPQALAGLGQELAAARARVAELQDAFLRARAETENLRRRVQEDMARAHKYAIESFADAMLPVKDSLEAALTVDAAPEALREGVEMTLKQLNAAFGKHRLSEIAPARGERLDPSVHQAISMEAVPQDANTIVSILQKGYMIADRLLRPALVTVAQERGGQAPEPDKEVL